MKKIKNFKKFSILEQIEELESQSQTENVNRYDEVKEELKEMIEKSLNSTDESVYKEFLRSYKKSPEDNQIEGLINDSDIYEFYLKWRNDVNDILLDINFFEDIPSEMAVYSLYDYIIVGTKRSIEEIIDMLEE